MESSPPPLPAGPAFRPPVHPARGWLLIFLGVALSAGIAYIASFIHRLILRNGAPGSTSHWTGSAELTRTMFELFGTVFVFGLVSMGAGVYILRTRRINRVLGVIMVLLAFGMAYLGYVITQTHVPR